MTDKMACGHEYETGKADRAFTLPCPVCYDNQREIERLTAKVQSAFFAGCDYGSKYAGDQYLGTPERQRGFDQWTCKHEWLPGESDEGRFYMCRICFAEKPKD